MGMNCLDGVKMENERDKVCKLLVRRSVGFVLYCICVIWFIVNVEPDLHPADDRVSMQADYAVDLLCCCWREVCKKLSSLLSGLASACLGLLTLAQVRHRRLHSHLIW